MFKTLYLHGIQDYLYSLRFRISFIIVVVVFVLSSISFMTSFGDVRENYRKYEQTRQELLQKRAENVTAVAVYRDQYVISPRDNTILADSKESVLPNLYRYSAYNVFNFAVRHDSVNPLIKRSESLTWGFVVSMFLSFIALLFTFDAISGEKEERTLSLVFSNRVPRRTFLISKICSAVTVVSGMLLIGMLISMIMLAVSGKVLLDQSFMIESLFFFIFSVLFITLFAVLGLFASSVTRSSNVSLLTSLCIWLFAAVVIPNTSVFWANKLFPIPTSDKVAQTISEEQMDLNKNAPEGSWSSHGGNLFYPRHELRANIQTKLLNAEKRHRDDYYQQMFRQFESTRNVTLVSPIAQFDYINEAFLGGGYLRFQKNWNDLHKFQEQFLQWFKEIDAKDENSPHWYNPYEDLSTSRKAVEVDMIPQYREQIAPFAERFTFVSSYLLVMVLTIAVVFGICFYLFVRYDVR